MQYELIEIKRSFIVSQHVVKGNSYTDSDKSKVCFIALKI